MTRAEIYLKRGADERSWELFKEWCRREGVSCSEAVMRFVRPHVAVHCAGNNQTLIEHMGLPKTQPLWRTCALSKKELIDGQFYCRAALNLLTPAICERRNGNSSCYREESC